MSNDGIMKAIRNAIEEQKILNLKIIYGLGGDLEIEFEPYIEGQDTLQYYFVWGRMSHSGLFYKMDVEKIKSASLLNKTFTISENACYQYGIEEEHYSVLTKFNNIFGMEAITNKETV